MVPARRLRFIVLAAPPAVLALVATACISGLASAGEDQADAPVGERSGTVFGTAPEPAPTVPTPQPTPDVEEEPLGLVVGEFDVIGPTRDRSTQFACDGLLSNVAVAETRGSELWLELPAISFQSDDSTTQGVTCASELISVSADGDFVQFLDPFVENSYFVERFRVVLLDPDPQRIEEVDIAGYSALRQEVANPAPACAIALIERSPTNRQPGIGWQMKAPMACLEFMPVVEEMLRIFSGPVAAVTSSQLEAIESFFAGEGRVFAGHCGFLATPPPDSVCVWEHGNSGFQLAYGVSPVDNPYYATDLLFLRRDPDGWIVDHREPGPCRNWAPCPPPPGATVEIVTDESDSCANVRTAAGIAAQIDDCLPHGTRAIVADWAQQVDARIWVPLEGGGFVSASFLTCVENCEPPDDGGFGSCGS